MLADRALRVALDIITDYDRHNLVGLLQNAVAAGQYRGTANYVPTIQATLKGMKEIIDNSAFNHYSPDFYEYLEQTDYGALLPKSIAEKIIAGLSGDPANHLPPAEISRILNDVNTMVNQGNGFVAFADGLGIRIDKVEEGNISLDLALPSIAFNDTFSGLIECHKQFDRLFMAASELTGNARASLRVSKTGSSLITTILFASHDNTMAIIAVYTAIVEAAHKTVQLIKAISDLRSANIPENIVTQVEESQAQISKKFIEERIETIVVQSGHVDANRGHELRNEVLIASRAVVKYVNAGARLSLSIENSSKQIQELKDLSGGQPLLAKMQEIRQLENSIERIRRGDPEIAKFIAADAAQAGTTNDSSAAVSAGMRNDDTPPKRP